jgi:hypothetical protein
MDINVSTPALLFPAISLLMLAFTNRFLTLATIIRGLHDRWEDKHDENVGRQIANLRHRVYLIRNMQAFGVASLICCVICMFVLFAGWLVLGKWIFALSLILMAVSLAISLREIQLSIGALDVLLHDMEG